MIANLPRKGTKIYSTKPGQNTNTLLEHGHIQRWERGSDIPRLDNRVAIGFLKNPDMDFLREAIGHRVQLLLEGGPYGTL